MATAPTTASPAGSIGKESSLASWVGPYVTNMLGQAYALSQQPYQPYQGQMIAGTAPLQQQGFQGLSSLQVPGSMGQAATTAGNVAQQAQGLGSFQPGTFNNTFMQQSPYQAGTFGAQTFGAEQAQQYMNPYLQSALKPQLQDLTRQADITRLSDLGKLTQAGAYGGSRQAIMDAEARRNLLNKQSDVLAQGYSTAYDKAQQAFTADQQRALEAQKLGEASRQFGYGQAAQQADTAAKYGLEAQKLGEASRQFGANFGLEGLKQQLEAARTQGQLGQQQFGAQQALYNQLMEAGARQRAIEQEGLAADYNEFVTQRDYPTRQVQFLQSMLQGLPVESITTAYPEDSTATKFQNALGGIAQIYDLIKGVGG